MLKEVVVTRWGVGNRDMLIKYADNGKVIYSINGVPSSKEACNANFKKKHAHMASKSIQEVDKVEELNRIYARYDNYTWAIENDKQQRRAEEKNENILKLLDALDKNWRLIINKGENNVKYT